MLDQSAASVFSDPLHQRGEESLIIVSERDKLQISGIHFKDTIRDN